MIATTCCASPSRVGRLISRRNEKIVMQSLTEAGRSLLVVKLVGCRALERPAGTALDPQAGRGGGARPAGQTPPAAWGRVARGGGYPRPPGGGGGGSRSPLRLRGGFGTDTG